MTSRDYKIAFAVGAASGVFWVFVLHRLSLLSGDKLAIAVVCLPFLFLAGVATAHRLFDAQLVHKFIKFVMVGVLNTGIDFFVFNLLIDVTGRSQGIAITLFKLASFLCALVNSYALNRLWTFEGEAAPSWMGQEFMRFAVVTLVGLMLNVGTTSLIANVTSPLYGLSQVRWDNLAAAVATASNLVWNFAGYKLFVFTSPQPLSQVSEIGNRSLDEV